MVDWGHCKVVDLRAECKRRGLPVSGLKATLVARLDEADSDTQAQAHTPAARTPKEGIREPQPAPQGRSGPLRSITAAVFCGAAAVAAGLWSQVVPPPREASVYESALQHQTAERENMTRFMVQRSEQMAAEIAAQLRAEGSDVEMLLAKEPFDVVVSGGGFRGQYAGGVLSILQLLEQEGLITIKRWAGSSIGACTAAHFATGNDFESFFRVPWAWQAMWDPRAFWRGARVVHEMEKHSLLPNALEVLKDGRLSVVLSELSWPRPWRTFFFFKRTTVTSFHSRDDLIQTLAASASIPFFTAPSIHGFSRWRGRFAADGGVVNNVPIFQDNKRPQLVINLGFLDYPHLYTFSPMDPAHHELVLKGQDDIFSFLLNPVHVSDCGLEEPAVGGSGSEHRLSCNSMGGSLMVLPPEEEGGEESEGDSETPGYWATLKKFHKEMRRRIELDAVPWLRIVCAEGGIALRLYMLVGAEEICSLPTIDVLEYMALLSCCFFTTALLLRM